MEVTGRLLELTLAYCLFVLTIAKVFDLNKPAADAR